MRAAIYSRRSKATDSGDSIRYQEGMCMDYARRLFGDCQFTAYEDEGFSGGSTNRPMYRKLMNDVAAGKVDVLVCYRLDRLSRNIGDFTATLTLLERCGVGFVSVTEAFDTTSPMGKAMLYIASVFAQLERDTTAQRIKDSFTELAKTGRRLTGTPPEGFSHKRLTDGQGRKYCVLEVLDGEAQKIRLVYDAFIQCESVAQTTEACVNNGMTTRKGEAVTARWVRNALRHPVYAQATDGIFAYLRNKGAVIQGETDENKGVAVYRMGSQTPIVSAGDHGFIINGTDWLAVQRLLDRQKPAVKVGEKKGALRGLVFCGLCGSPMRPAGIRKGGWFSYVCVNKEKSRGRDCNVINLPMTADMAVTEAMIKNLLEEGSRELGLELVTRLCDVEICGLLSSVIKRITWDGGQLKVYLLP